MDSNEFVNVYIEVLNSEISEAIKKNNLLATRLLITEKVVQQLQEELAQARQEIELLNTTPAETKPSKSSS